MVSVIPRDELKYLQCKCSGLPLNENKGTVWFDSSSFVIHSGVFILQGVKDSKLLNMLTFNFWPTGKDLPTSMETFLVMLGRVTSYRRSFGDNPVTVLCL